MSVNSFQSNFTALTQKISEWYQPFNTVAHVNEYFKKYYQKLIFNGIFFVSSMVFLISGTWALYRNFAYEHPLMFNIKFYILILAVMLGIDILASFFESRQMIEEKKTPSVPDVVSLLLSVIVGILTLIVLIQEIKKHASGKKVTELTSTLLIFKMVLALVVAINSGLILKKTLQKDNLFNM